LKLLFIAVLFTSSLFGYGTAIKWISTLEDAKEFLFDESKAKTPGLMFSFYWFFERMKNLN